VWVYSYNSTAHTGREVAPRTYHEMRKTSRGRIPHATQSDLDCVSTASGQDPSIYRTALRLKCVKCDLKVPVRSHTNTRHSNTHFFTGQIPFLMSNQQCTEGRIHITYNKQKNMQIVWKWNTIILVQ